MPPKEDLNTEDNAVLLLTAIIKHSDIEFVDWDAVGNEFHRTGIAANGRWKAIRKREPLLKDITIRTKPKEQQNDDPAPVGKKGKGKKSKKVVESDAAAGFGMEALAIEEKPGGKAVTKVTKKKAEVVEQDESASEEDH